MTGKGRPEPVVVGLSPAIYGHSPALSHGHSNVGSTTGHRTFVRGSYRSRRGADEHRGSRARSGNGGRGRPSSCSRSQGMRAFLAAGHFASRRSISACWISRFANCSETKRDDQHVSLCTRSDNRPRFLTVRTGR
jgi:hypothetical protein